MNIVDRAKNIIMTPKTEWPVIAGEEPVAAQIISGYVIPLALIPAVATMLGYGLIGRGVVSSFTWGIAMAIISFVVTVGGVYLTAFVVDFLAPNFGSQKNFGRSMQLVAYSYTPAWVAGILHIVPVLGILVFIASLYGFYIMYLGFPHTMKTPEDKVVVYMVVAIIVLIVVYFVLTAILTAIVFGIFGLSALSMMGS
ncbi:MAG TPA: Yip1 family protein [Bacteroidota bacterium]|nr:Yip1 family protein [Bacteroidota bacterium]